MHRSVTIAAIVLLCSSFGWCQTTSLDEVVGKYTTGASLTVYVLKLNPDGTFSFTENGDVGDTSLVGTFIVTGRSVHLKGEKANGMIMWYFRHGPLGEFLLVPWGEREYLVTPHQLPEFCNHVNSGHEPRSYGELGYFMLRDGDVERPAAGVPDLPAEWKKCLFDPPLVAEVVEVDGESVVLSVGDSSNVFEGMEFRFVDPEVAAYCSLEVTSIETNTSRATLNRSCEPQTESGVLPVGLVVSTRVKR